MKRCCAVLLLLSTAAPVLSANYADEARDAMAQGRLRSEVTIDNDSLLLKHDDGFYTSGLQFDRQYILRQERDSILYGWRIGQALYTASDINLPPAKVRPPDHPYAGWLFVGAYREAASDDGSIVRVGFDLGCIGPCAGGETVQTTLHRLLHQPLPQGWAKQVKNEAGLILYADVAPMRWQPLSTLELKPNFHGRFGNIFTDAGVGLSLRGGQLDLSSEQTRLQGFARIDVSAVAYNATLQGGYFSSDNPHTVTPKRFIGELEAGAAWQSGSFGLRASVLRRSNEINGLPNSIGTQNFVRLLFSYAP